MHDCLVCGRISEIRNNNNKFFVKELETGYVVLGDFQFYEGYTLFIFKEHKTELHELNKKIRSRFLKEMSEVAEAVYHAFKPQKLNYELLGNSCPHLHWHIFPRRESDPRPESSIWCIEKNVRCSLSAKPTDEHLERLKIKLLATLKK